MELISSGFVQFIALFNPWLFLVGVIVIIALFYLEYKLNPDRGDLGLLGGLGILFTIVGPSALMVFHLHGIGPHYDIIEKDIATQLSITEISWEKDSQFTGKDKDGKFVSCGILETNKENTYRVVCY